MGKITRRLFELGATEEDGPHIALEDLARMAEGTVSDDERERFAHHLNRCSRCVTILQRTLEDLEEDRQGERRSFFQRHRTLYAVAASVALVVLVGGGGLYRYVQQKEEVVRGGAVHRPETSPEVAGKIISIAPDSELAQILQSGSMTFSGEQARGIAALLSKWGIAVERVSQVIMVNAYSAAEEPAKLRIVVRGSVILIDPLDE